MKPGKESNWAITPEDCLWLHDKLILSKKLGYVCGPAGVGVPEPGNYIVRPITNLPGMGRGAEIIHIDEDTDDLPLGHFWCEVFEGRHITVDYVKGEQVFAAEGTRQYDNDPCYRFDKWTAIDDDMPLPDALSVLKQFDTVNVEYIDQNAIEVHLEHGGLLGRDHSGQTFKEALVVWDDRGYQTPEGYTFVEAPDYKRKGFFVK